MSPETLLRDIADGVHLCEVARKCDHAEGEVRKLQGKSKTKAPAVVLNHVPDPITPEDDVEIPATIPDPRAGKKRLKFPRYQPPDPAAVYKRWVSKRQIHWRPLRHKVAERGGRKARENVASFLRWAKGLGLVNRLAFAVDDLVRYRDPRRVIYGLLDVARRLRGMQVPKYVAFEVSLTVPRRGVVAPSASVCVALISSPVAYLPGLFSASATCTSNQRSLLTIWKLRYRGRCLRSRRRATRHLK